MKQFLYIPGNESYRSNICLNIKDIKSIEELDRVFKVRTFDDNLYFFESNQTLLELVEMISNKESPNRDKDFFLSVNGNEYTRIDLEKAYESWNKDYEENPENFEPNFDNTTGADSVNALIMYLEKTLIPEFPKDKIG